MITLNLFQAGLFLQIAATGSGRPVATLAALVALTSIFIGRQALKRAARGIDTARQKATLALVLGVVSTVYSIIHLMLFTGDFGTGSGKAGAIVAIALGLTGIVLGALAYMRLRRKTV